MIIPSIIVVTALLGCFFTAANYALLDYSRSRLAEEFERRNRIELMNVLERNRNAMLLATGLLRTAMNLVVLLCSFAWFVLPDTTEAFVGLAIAFVAAAVVIAVMGVAIPVSWSRYAAEPLIAHSFSILLIVTRIMKPIMLTLHIFDPFVRRLLGVPKRSEDDTSPQEQEILDAVSEGERSGFVDQEQKDMIEAVVSFPTTTVDQIMTPRTDIEGISADATLEDVKRFVRDAGHSRVPVYDGDLDHIVGVLYVKDLIPLLGTFPNGQGFDLRAIVREAVFVPETKTLRDLLTQLKELKVHLALVLDEYGGTAGLVTIEDILEEIVGEIRDEYEPVDEQAPAIDRVDERTFEAHGRVYIDEVNDELNVSLPDDEDYDTIGGFVLATLGRIPDSGEQFDYEQLRITVVDAEKTRVNRVRIEVLSEQPTEAAGSMDA